MNFFNVLHLALDKTRRKKILSKMTKKDKFFKNTCRGNQSLAEKMLFVLWLNNNNFLYLTA